MRILFATWCFPCFGNILFTPRKGQQKYLWNESFSATNGNYLRLFFIIYKLKMISYDLFEVRFQGNKSMTSVLEPTRFYRFWFMFINYCWLWSIWTQTYSFVENTFFIFTVIIQSVPRGFKGILSWRSLATNVYYWDYKNEKTSFQ